MKRAKRLCKLSRTKVKAFTLLECLVALLCISGSILVYEGLTKSLSANVSYLSTNQQSDWLLFSQQLRSEIQECRLDRVENDKLYVTKSGKSLAFGKYKSNDFRKTNADGRGYQPMLFGIESVSMSQSEQQVTINLIFESGLERSFIYVFEKES
jgi:competence protein ComGF